MLIEEGRLALPYPNPAFAKVEVGVNSKPGTGADLFA